MSEENIYNESAKHEKAVSSESFESFKLSPNATEERMMRWVCRVSDPRGCRIGSAILIGPQTVLTAYHIVKGQMTNLHKFEFEFDDIQFSVDRERFKGETANPVQNAAWKLVSEVSDYDGNKANFPSAEGSVILKRMFGELELPLWCKEGSGLIQVCLCHKRVMYRVRFPKELMVLGLGVLVDSCPFTEKTHQRN